MSYPPSYPNYYDRTSYSPPNWHEDEDIEAFTKAFARLCNADTGEAENGPKKSIPQDKPWSPDPSYYTRYEPDPASYCLKNRIPFAEGNVVKYTLRHDLKNGAEDIRKAIRYLQMILEETYKMKSTFTVEA